MKGKKIKQKKLQQVTAYIENVTNEELIKYCSLKNVSKSQAIENFINNGLQLSSSKENIDYITNEIDRCMVPKLKQFEDRSCKIQAKTAKASLTSLYLVLQLLESILDIRQEDKKLLLKDMLEDSEKKAYIILKSGFLERDITELFRGKEE